MKENQPLSLLNGGHDAELDEVIPAAAGAGKHAKLLPAQLAAIAVGSPLNFLGKRNNLHDQRSPHPR